MNGYKPKGNANNVAIPPSGGTGVVTADAIRAAMILATAFDHEIYIAPDAHVEIVSDGAWITAELWVQGTD